MTNVQTGRDLWTSHHQPRTKTTDDFDDLAGSKLAQGHAMYRAMHGDIDAQHQLDEVNAAYEALHDGPP